MSDDDIEHQVNEDNSIDQSDLDGSRDVSGDEEIGNAKNELLTSSEDEEDMASFDPVASRIKRSAVIPHSHRPRKVPARAQNIPQGVKADQRLKPRRRYVPKTTKKNPLKKKMNSKLGH
jgi:hypothetical protein